MANRLSTIVTKTGDAGYTGLGDGSRVSKSHIRVCAIGDLDEFNCHIGALLLNPLDDGMKTVLKAIQNDVFDMGGELCIPGHAMIQADRVSFLERQIAEINESLPRLEEFLLPNGIKAAVDAHICRAIARRAERNVVELSQTTVIRTELLQYLNRLSDYFFVLARLLNRLSADPLAREVLWDHQRS
jgi:cob(I)alamin adenosyltransferase